MTSTRASHPDWNAITSQSDSARRHFDRNARSKALPSPRIAEGTSASTSKRQGIAFTARSSDWRIGPRVSFVWSARWRIFFFSGCSYPGGTLANHAVQAQRGKHIGRPVWFLCHASANVFDPAAGVFRREGIHSLRARLFAVLKKGPDQWA